MNANEFKPDWETTWTAAEAEHELKDFKFTGPGWYFTKTDTMLVIPVDRTDRLTGVEPQWSQKHQLRPRLTGDEEKFRFYIYNGRHPGDAFNAIVNAPVRVDEELTMSGFIEDADGVLPYGQSLHDLE